MEPSLLPHWEGALCLHGAAAQWRGRERTAAELARSPGFGSYFEMFLMSLLQGDGCWGEHRDVKARDPCSALKPAQWVSQPSSPQDWGNEGEGCEMPGRGCSQQLLSKADFELCLSIPVCQAQQACSPAPGEYELPSPGCPFLWVCVTSSSHGPQHHWLGLTLKRLFFF